MTTREIIEYAKDNGYDSTMFALKNVSGEHICVGKFEDAYYELIRIPLLGNGVTRIKEIESTLGYGISFDVIDEKTYVAGSYLDFVLRGKEAPEDIKDNFKKIG
jgi:hypothetical protein